MTAWHEAHSVCSNACEEGNGCMREGGVRREGGGGGVVRVVRWCGAVLGRVVL